MVIAVVWLFNSPNVFAQQTPTEILEAVRWELACDGCQQTVYGEIHTANAPVKKFTLADRVNLEEDTGCEDMRIHFPTPEQAPSMQKAMAGVEYIAHVCSSFEYPRQAMWDPIAARLRSVDQGPSELVLAMEINHFALTPWAYLVGVDRNPGWNEKEVGKVCAEVKYLWSREGEEIKGEPCRTYLRRLSLWVKEIAPGRKVVTKMVLHEVAGDRVFEYLEYQLQNGYYRPSSFRVTGPQGGQNEIRLLCWRIEKDKDSFNQSVLADSSLGKTDIPMPVCEKTDTLTQR